MEKIKFGIVKELDQAAEWIPNNTLSILMLFLIALVFITLEAVSLFEKQWSILVDWSYAGMVLFCEVILFFLIVAVAGAMMLKRIDRPSSFKRYVQIEPENIIIVDAIFPVRELSNLVLRYEGYDGGLPTSYPAHRRTLSSGLNNKITFEYKGKKYGYTIYISSDDQIKSLKKVFKYWYEHQISFKEYLLMGRCYLLRAGLSYKEIQQLKKQYNIVW